MLRAFLQPNCTPEQRIAREAEIARVAAAAHAARPTPPKPKLGRPFSKRALTINIDCDEAAAAEPDEKRRKYTHWFSSPLIHEILRTYAQERSARRTVAWLQRHRPLLGYEHLSESNLRKWFDKDHKLLPRFRDLLVSGAYKAGPGQERLFDEHPAVEEKIKGVLRQMREGHKTGISVNIDTIRWVMRSIIDADCPALGEKLALSKSFLSRWARDQMKWTWRTATTEASKLPEDWEQRGITMAKRIAVAIETNEIHPSLVINADQSGLLLVPASSRTYETSGSRSVPVAGLNDKRQITAVVASSLDGVLLPLQLIFTGLTPACLPVHTEESTALGVHLTMSDNHWSSQQTMQQWIEHIVLPHRAAMIAAHDLKQDAHILLLLDVWAVHISKEFRSFLSASHPYIHLVFVPANCTSKLQVADVALNYPFKHGFKRRFNAWAAKIVDDQIRAGGEVVGIKPFLGMLLIKPKVLEWALESWKSLAEEQELIRKGWRNCVSQFYDIHDKDQRIDAMRQALTNAAAEAAEAAVAAAAAAAEATAAAARAATAAAASSSAAAAVAASKPATKKKQKKKEQPKVEEQELEPELDEDGYIAQESEEEEDETEKEIMKEKIEGTRKSTRQAKPPAPFGYTISSSQLKFS